MMSHRNHETQLEIAIDSALAQPPQTIVPAGFAARVRAALPAPQRARPRSNAGRRMAFGCAAGLLLAVFYLAPHTAPSFSSMAFDFELSLLAELACITVWLAATRYEA